MRCGRAGLQPCGKSGDRSSFIRNPKNKLYSVSQANIYAKSPLGLRCPPLIRRCLRYLNKASLPVDFTVNACSVKFFLKLSFCNLTWQAFAVENSQSLAQPLPIGVQISRLLLRRAENAKGRSSLGRCCLLRLPKKPTATAILAER